MLQQTHPKTVPHIPFALALHEMPGVAHHPVLVSRMWDISAAQLYFDDFLIVDLHHDVNVVLAESIFPYSIYRVMCATISEFCYVFGAMFWSLLHLLLLFLRSQYFKLIYAYYHDLFSLAILVSCIPCQDVCTLSYLVFMHAMHNTMFKHDFVACIASFFSRHARLSAKLLLYLGQCCSTRDLVLLPDFPASVFFTPMAISCS